MSLPKIHSNSRCLTRHRYITSKEKKDWTYFLYQPQQTPLNVQQTYFQYSQSVKKVRRPLPKIKTEPDREILKKIEKYQKTYFSPSNCARSLKLGEVLRDRMVRPIPEEQFKSSIKPRKKKGFVVKSIGLEEFIYDGKWNNS